jgi:hypothetical protein
MSEGMKACRQLTPTLSRPTIQDPMRPADASDGVSSARFSWIGRPEDGSMIAPISIAGRFFQKQPSS